MFRITYTPGVRLDILTGRHPGSLDRALVTCHGPLAFMSWHDRSHRTHAQVDAPSVLPFRPSPTHSPMDLSHPFRHDRWGFDGDRRTAFLDVRSYGKWGEGHMHPFGDEPISADEYRHHIQRKRTPERCL